MATTVGIDLGTSNSAVALKKIDTQILYNQEGKALTPSVVFIKKGINDIWEEGSSIVGDAARNWQKQSPENTISSVKRLMGRNINDQYIQKIIKEKLVSYNITPLSLGSSNSIAISLLDKDTIELDKDAKEFDKDAKELGKDNKEYNKEEHNKFELTPEEISALILKKLINDAQKSIDDQIESAIITVPAYFNDRQKHATRIAAAKAGIKVPRLLPEPTSAAISFGMDELKGEGSQTIMVYDFGGGTLDISILTIGGGNIIEQGKGGDMWLGGNDIDQSLLQLIIQKASEDLDVPLLPIIENMSDLDQKKLKLELIRKAEAAKIELSKSDEVSVEVFGLIQDQEGDPLDIDISIERAEFEKCISSFVENSISIMHGILEGINFSIELIDQVLLVGGSSQIPLVQKKLADVFGIEKVKLHTRPMLAIAEGAAIAAHKVDVTNEAEEAKVSGFGEIIHTSAHDYFIKTAEGDYHLLVPRYTPLPFETDFKVNLLAENQHLAHFPFYNQVNNQFESIGDLWLSFSMETEEKSVVKGVNLKFKISEDNLIEISANKQDLSYKNVTRKLSRGHVDEQLYLNIEKGLKHVNEMGEYYLAQDYEMRMVNIISNINQVLDKENENVDHDLLQKTQKLQKNAQELVERNEPVYSNIWYYEHMIDQFASMVELCSVKPF